MKDLQHQLEDAELTIQAFNDMMLRRENEILQLQRALLKANALLNGHFNNKELTTDLGDPDG